MKISCYMIAAGIAAFSPSVLGQGVQDIPHLYSDSHYAKLLHTSMHMLEGNESRDAFPHITTPGGPNIYEKSPQTIWVAGFFPGNLWLLVERMRLLNNVPENGPSEEELIEITRGWSKAMEHQKNRTDTHDMGFLIQPPFQLDYELTGSEEAKQVVVEGAESLMERYNPTVGSFRSWDSTQVGGKNFTSEDMDKHFLVIIDNMMNLDLLYSASEFTGDQKFAEAATKHAETSAAHFFRPDHSTVHVVNFDPNTGEYLANYTRQGLSDDSCWARGQAWGLNGYAQTAHWTGRDDFLEISRNAADYFIDNLPEDGVPYWDFDAGRGAEIPRDTSAGAIAACGFLTLHDLLLEKDKDAATKYYDAAVKLAKDLGALSATPEASIIDDKNIDLGENDWESILFNATSDNNPTNPKPRRMANHGMIYADYYYLELGNRLVKMQNRD